MPAAPPLNGLRQHRLPTGWRCCGGQPNPYDWRSARTAPMTDRKFCTGPCDDPTRHLVPHAGEPVRLGDRERSVLRRQRPAALRPSGQWPGERHTADQHCLVRRSPGRCLVPRRQSAWVYGGHCHRLSPDRRPSAWCGDGFGAHRTHSNARTGNRRSRLRMTHWQSACTIGPYATRPLVN